jgi:cytochrome c oxidase assembly factor CtaG
MHTSLLGALITVAGRLWYPLYAARAVPFGVDAQEDQTLAGLVMWVPCGVVLTLVALALFAAWLVGVLAGKGGFIHILILCAAAVAFVQWVADRRARQG